MTKEDIRFLMKRSVAAFDRMNGGESTTSDDMEIVWFGSALKDCKALVQVKGNKDKLYAIGYDFHNKSLKIETLFDKEDTEE